MVDELAAMRIKRILSTCDVQRNKLLGWTVTREFRAETKEGYIYQPRESFWGPTPEAAASAMLALRGHHFS